MAHDRAATRSDARRSPGTSARVTAAFVLCLLWVGALSLAPQSAMAAADSAPSLAFITSPGHALAVVGRNWGRHVVVTARVGDSMAGVPVNSLPGGTFTVALDFALACGGIAVEARDYHGDTLTVRHAGPLCPNRPGESPPRLTILSGVRPTSSVHALSHPTGPKSLTMRLGDTLKVTAGGGVTSTYLPSVSGDHFVPLQQGAQKPATCSQGSCSGDRYWSWIAVKRGRDQVTLTPSCRLSRPPCGLADVAVRVVIE